MRRYSLLCCCAASLLRCLCALPYVPMSVPIIIFVRARGGGQLWAGGGFGSKEHLSLKLAAIRIRLALCLLCVVVVSAVIGWILGLGSRVSAGLLPRHRMLLQIVSLSISISLSLFALRLLLLSTSYFPFAAAAATASTYVDLLLFDIMAKYCIANIFVLLGLAWPGLAWPGLRCNTL